jgi:hypothetical protein
MQSKISGQGKHKRQPATHVNRTRSKQFAFFDSGWPALTFLQAPDRIEMTQNQNRFAATRALPTGDQVVTRVSILDDLNLCPASLKLPGKPIGELIQWLFLIRRGVRVHKPSEPLNHLRLHRPKKRDQVGRHQSFRAHLHLSELGWPP